MFCLEGKVRYSELYADAKMSLPAVLSRLQDCCIFDSEEIGMGLHFLAQQKRAWVLSFWQVIICRYPGFGEQISTYTWPYDFKGFLGYRNFKMEDASCQTVAYANSVWTYLDTQTGMPVRIPQTVQQRYMFYPPYEMECAGRKIRLEEGMRQEGPVHVARSHIDTNRHVNNGKYIMIAQEYLPEDFKVCQIRAEYKKAAVRPGIIYPKVKEGCGRFLVSLENEAAEPYAIVEFREDYV